MALYATGAGQDLQRTSSLPASNAFTLMGWSKIPAGGGTVVTATPEAEFYFNVYPPGSAIYFGGYAGGAWWSNGWGYTPPVETWFHWYVKGDAGGVLEAGWKLAGDAAYDVHSLSGWPTTPVYTSLRLNSDAYGSSGTAIHAAVKLWNAALTAAELLNESRTIRPQRIANLNLWTPMVASVVAEAVKDRSGNGRDWTSSGAITVADGPPVSWGGSSLMFVSLAGAGVHVIAGAASGAGASTLSASARRPLSGSAPGVGAATANAGARRPLVGLSAGLGAAAADVAQGPGAIAATAVGAGSALGAMLKNAPLVGAAPGVGAAAGAMSGGSPWIPAAAASAVWSPILTPGEIWAPNDTPAVNWSPK